MHLFTWWPARIALSPVIVLPMVVVLAVATFTDLRSRRIPNWLVLPFMAVGIGVSGWLQGWHGMGESLSGIALGTLIYGFFFWMGGMGAGDVKLCAGIGAWIGPRQLFLALVLTGLIGGVMALVWAAWGGFLKDLLQRTSDLAFGWKERGETDAGNPVRRRMPYAPAIALGTLISFFAH